MNPILLRLFCLSILFCPAILRAQGGTADYLHAEQHSYSAISKLVRNIEATPVWDKKGISLKIEKASGYSFMSVELPKGKVAEAFNHATLASLLTKELGENINPDSLPFQTFTFSPDRSKITFTIEKIDWEYLLTPAKLIKINRIKAQKNESYSPDSTYKVIVKNYNLWAVNLKTGEERKLTSNGVDHYDYATPESWWQVNDLAKGEPYDPEIEITWAPDSKKFFTFRLDRTRVKNMYLLQSVPDSGWRAKVFFYERDLPGENSTQDLEYYVFDLEKNLSTRVQLHSFPTFLVNTGPGWFSDSKRIFFSKFDRGYQGLTYYVIDAGTGRADTLFRENAKTMIEYQMAFGKKTNDNKYLIWASERDGWNHLYLYDIDKKQLLNQVTQGDFVVRSIEFVDEKLKTIWFIAGGKEPGRDPYFRHLYKIGFDGSGLTLLTPENADHDVRVSPDGKYVVDNYSRIDQPTISVLRRMDTGKEIVVLQKADISELLKSGFNFPVPFVTKGRDGVTDIYGAIFYPTGFDSTKKYPVIDATYTGPQAVRTPKNFKGGYRNNDVGLADIGFIVVTIDGMGTAMRSKVFHDVSYENLGDIGAADHILAIKQLASTRPYMDIEQVGIYGHSAGAYDATHALLTHSEFYKAGFAMAGNHDNRMSKAWWDEQYMGLPGEHYNQQSNLTLAGNLQGKLFLVHGDMDQNVNPANTIRLAGELIKHNKDFEMLIVPNIDHGGILFNLYVNRRMWNFFTKNLLHVEPPKMK